MNGVELLDDCLELRRLIERSRELGMHRAADALEIVYGATERAAVWQLAVDIEAGELYRYS